MSDAVKMRHFGSWFISLCKERDRASQKMTLWGANTTTRVLKTRENWSIASLSNFFTNRRDFILKTNKPKLYLDLDRLENANSWHKKEKRSIKEKSILMASGGGMPQGLCFFTTAILLHFISVLYNGIIASGLGVVRCPGQCGYLRIVHRERVVSPAHLPVLLSDLP